MKLRSSKIFGVGIDLVEIERFGKILEKNETAFLKRISHAADRRHAPRTQNKARLTQYWAARFAVKEAFSKALGTGISENLRFAAIGVKKSRSGQPKIEVDDSVKKILVQKGINAIHLSISHTQSFATAVVVLESKEN